MFQPKTNFLVATPNHIVATWKSVMILVWRAETTLEGVGSAQDAYNELARRNPGGVFLLTVVEENAPLPAPEVRIALAKFLRSGEDRTIFSAVVQEGTGFRGAAVRSVVTGLAMLAKLPYPHKVFPNVEAAVSWFYSSAPASQRWDEGELRQAVLQVRERALATSEQANVSQGLI